MKRLFNPNRISRTIFHLTFLMCLSLNVLAQEQIVEKFDEYRKNNLQEKIFLHTDRENYLCGELMWFKAYYVDATRHEPLDLSKIAYVELVDENNNAVLQGKILLEKGKGEGSFFVPTSITSGEYVLRAYTNWMKNFSPDFYFHKHIRIINTFKKLPFSESEKDTIGFDLSFFPEGGNLVYGIKSRVAFKAVNEKGEGPSFKGMLINSQGDNLLEFNSEKFGLGSFDFTPQRSQSYKVIAVTEDSLKYEFSLPEIFEKGYVISLSDSNGEVVVDVNTEKGRSENVYLLIHCRQNISFFEKVRIENGRARFVIDETELEDGISHITLFNDEQIPVCERLYFKKPMDKLAINIATDQPDYKNREQINIDLLTLKSSDKSPVSSNLSLSVFQLDSINTNEYYDILSYLYLDSELKGKILYPDYYLSGKGDIDLLMLTHGWSRFKWEEILNNNTVEKEFVPEFRGHVVSGKVFEKQSGESAEGIITYLSLPGNSPQMKGDKSDKNGEVDFILEPFYGTRDLLLKTDFSRDSTYGFSLKSPFSEEYRSFNFKDIDISGSLKNILEERSIGLQTRNVFFSEKLNAFMYQPDSTTFYNQPDARYYLDDYTRFNTMEDVMREYVPGIWVRKNKKGFYFRAIDLERDEMFDINPMVIYDGVPIFDIDKVMRIDPLKVKRLDVVNRRYHYGSLSFDGIVYYNSYTGNLPTYEMDPRSMIIEYEGLLDKREFYSPVYDENKNSRLPDFRNLLMWKGDIDTDSEGKSVVHFYTSDESGKYMIVVQGMNNEGLAGFADYTFEVKGEKNQ